MRFRYAKFFAVAFCLTALALAACGPEQIAQFWRPIAEPNIEMPFQKAQRKLEFDLNQCHCGIYPANVSRDESIEFMRDHQRLAATGETILEDEAGECMQQPSLVVSECMRARGWEPTNCSGRMPLPGGGSLCASFIPDNQ